MTNNINGIDVSECPLFDKKTGCYHTFNGECVKDSCALYKWLLEYKRLQEENEELKNKNNDLIEEIASGNIDIAILQKENEKLKADLKGETEQAQKWYQLETDKHFLALKFCKTLEEIREYCEKCKKCVEIGDEVILYTVIKKINEVLNDRN